MMTLSMMRLSSITSLQLTSPCRFIRQLAPEMIPPFSAQQRGIQETYRNTFRSALFCRK
jgi:hypothetical protein